MNRGLHGFVAAFCIVWAPTAQALPAIAWPAGTQVQTLSQSWFGTPARIQLATIPLPVADALDALVAAAPAPWQVSIAGGRVLLAPHDDAWRLTLTAAGAATVATLSRVVLDEARALALPPWLGPGWQVRVATRDAGSTRWVFTRDDTPAHAAALLGAGLRRDGWRLDGRPAEAITRWRRGVDALTLAIVPAAAGAGVFAVQAVEARP